MMRSFVHFMVIILLSGCAGPWRYTGDKYLPHQCFLPIPIGVSSNVPGIERQYIEVAIEFWNKELGQPIFFDMGEVPFPPDSELAKGLVPIGYPDHFKAGGNDVAMTIYSTWKKDGCMVNTYIAIIIPLMDLAENQRYAAMKHELGHVLGLDDSKDKKTIMYGTLPEFWGPFPQHLLPEELEALKQVYSSK